MSQRVEDKRTHVAELQGLDVLLFEAGAARRWAGLPHSLEWAAAAIRLMLSTQSRNVRFLAK